MRTLAAFAACASVYTGIFLTIGQSTVRQLDLATQAQCQRRDWPASQDRAHRDFCATYLTNP